MSDNDELNNAVKKVVQSSKKPIVITLELTSNGNLQISGPLTEPITMLGMLELGKQMVHDIQKKGGAQQPQQIVVPTVGPKRPI